MKQGAPLRRRVTAPLPETRLPMLQERSPRIRSLICILAQMTAEYLLLSLTAPLQVLLYALFQ